MNPLNVAPPNGLTLRLKKQLEARINGVSLQPTLLMGKTVAEIRSQRMDADSKTSYRIDDLFEVIGDPSEHLLLQGDCRRIDHLGAGMKDGKLSIMGNAGNDCGEGLAGGFVEVFGDCGDRLGTGMRRGSLTVHGSAGDFAVGPAIGSTRGMSGGDCCVMGNVGQRAGERMRRGIFFVQGDAGDHGAAQMIAGTLIVLGSIGKHWGLGMRRGSIILSHEQSRSFDATLTPAREFELSFLPLLWNHLRSCFSDSNASIPQSRWAFRQIGDRANDGMGEVLTLSRHQLL